MPRPLFIVDAFAGAPFTGNPAAVCVLDQPGDDAWMQRVAAEMNLSETAFVQPLPGESWALRWFTPAAEVELCGHATLASAHVLWETGRAPREAPVVFETRFRGALTCQLQQGDGIAMDFPADPASPAHAPAALLAALEVDPAELAQASRSRYDWIIELRSAAAVERAAPEFAALALATPDARGVALTARGDGDIDVVSRFFAPRLRINEDPVTGSLHCVLGPYWSPRLAKPTLRCRQASARGGELVVTTRGDRVELAGRAVTVLRGELV